jgi:uncharacterized protein (TIGR02391 family)
VRNLVAHRALAAAAAAARVAAASGLDQPPQRQSPELPFDEFVTDKELRAASRSLFEGGHYSQAVFEAFKLVNNLVKKRSKVSEDGASLMFKVFPVKNPVLRLNTLSSTSDKDEQAGYQQILAGTMTGVRNPRGHEHGNLDTRQTATELLSLANHLLRKVRKASKATKAKKGTPT